MKKNVLYIATSIDGYIADEHNDISWLSMVESEGEDYGYGDFIGSVDTVIMGRKTYDKVMSMVEEFPHKNRNVYVLSHSKKGFDGNVHYINNVQEFLSKIENETGLAFCDGGADTIHELLQYIQFDRIIISIIPIMLGNGIRLFSGTYKRHTMRLLRSSTFPSGLVQLWYEPLKDTILEQ